MTDLLTLGTTPAVTGDEFDPAEIAGMRTAGWILLMSAALVVLTLFSGVRSSAVAQMVVDTFLGTQLLRLRHSWRAWAMVRAALGVVIGAFGIVIGFLALGVGGIPGRPAPLPRLMVVAGVTAYCASLLLLLYSRPTLRRVRLGQLVFAASVLLVVAGGVVTALREI